MDKVFVPFMLGTISLILFFNSRNAYLGTRIREICNRFTDKKPKRETNFSIEIAEQLFALMERYRRGAKSLVAAIGAVICFGTMLLLYFLLHPELYGFTTDPETASLTYWQRMAVGVWKRPNNC